MKDVKRFGNQEEIKRLFEEVREISSCSICQRSPPLNAVMCKSCNNVFCSDCIKGWLKKSFENQSSPCPFRCKDIYFENPPKFYKFLINLNIAGVDEKLVEMEEEITILRENNSNLIKEKEETIKILERKNKEKIEEQKAFYEEKIKALNDEKIEENYKKEQIYQNEIKIIIKKDKENAKYKIIIIFLVFLFMLYFIRNQRKN